MNRITGAFVLLVGLGGCLSPTAPSTQGNKKGVAAANKAKAPLPTANVPAPPGVGAPPPPTALPTNPQWAPGHVTARPPEPKPLPPGASLPTPLTATTPAATPPAQDPPAQLTRVIDRSAQPLPTELPPPVRTNLAPKGPPSLPSGMAMAKTPPPEIVTPGKIQQVGHVAMPGQPDPVVPALVPPPGEEPKLTTPPPALTTAPPAPAVKNTVPLPETGKASKPGAPLVRLVNTKRITLNFQVQNVGQSGLSSVELWYTQDGKEWKKYDAPTQAQAYVVEVDEEGMYGFTLLAKSGLGLGKEPPQAGDQPQVWVIVDLSRPDVQLQEVTPSVSAKAQQVVIGWKASDKNLARQPVSLFYAEKPEGPWKVIASHLDNTGKYLWNVPADAPAKFLVRVEAADLAGNVGRAQSMQPVLLDMMKPDVIITNVEANSAP